MQPATTLPESILYPDSDGKPMSDNSLQAQWIFFFYGNLLALFHHREDVFVAADNLWYPVEGEPDNRQAPDVYVVFGRPKGYRGSYKQWKEEGIPISVVFEILSPNNTPEEMADKLAWYDEHGVTEYFEYDPDANTLKAYFRQGTVLRRIYEVDGLVSPLLGIRFQMDQPEMRVYGPSGTLLINPDEAVYLMWNLTARIKNAETLLKDAKTRTEEATARIKNAETRTRDAAAQNKDTLKQLEKYCELSRRARREQATAEELAELGRLDEET